LINNRQNGRRRGRGGPQVRNGSGNGPERGNRIDNRARGNAAQLHEKYRNLARDAQTQGDRVMTEYYLQFADHYFRVLSEGRARFEEQNPNQNQQRRQQMPNDDFDDGGFEGDGGDEGGEGDMVQREAQREPRRFDREPRRDGNYDDGEQPRANGNENPYNRDNSRDNSQGREPRDNHYGRNGQQGRDTQGRDQQGRDNRDARDPRPMTADRGEQRPPREAYQPRDVAPIEVAAPPVDGNVGDTVESEIARPRRGRPPRRAAPIVAEGEAHAQIEIDRLPPAFAPVEADEAAPSPRARRKSVEALPEEGVRAVEGEPVDPSPRRRRTRRDAPDDSNVAA
jgi:hypothetical protein